MRRVAIVGSHGVGKTTLGHYIFKNYSGSKKIIFNTGIARKLIRAGYMLNMEATTESYIQYIIEQLSAEQSAQNCDLFISDRTLLDPLSYAIVNQKFSETNIPESTLKLLESVWLMEKDLYDLYVFVPIEFPMQLNGIRPQNEAYRKAVEVQIRYFLEHHQLHYICVKGTVEERCSQVLLALKSD